jgi:nucleolar protein 6
VAVRLQTHKDTNKSKGCGFVEFTNIESLRRALQLHGFPMGKKGRKINVELSAGGGGNSKQRLQKIKTKRDKLGKERSKTHEKSKVSRENERQKKAAKLSAQKKRESNASTNGGPSSSSSSSSSSSVTAAAPVPGGSFGAAKAQQ